MRKIRRSYFAELFIETGKPRVPRKSAAEPVRVPRKPSGKQAIAETFDDFHGQRACSSLAR